MKNYLVQILHRITWAKFGVQPQNQELKMWFATELYIYPFGPVESVDFCAGHW